ncbi:serine/threonine-protein kinase [Streptomyces sp. AK02-01A]|uniref:serine/threonine-protein kinase n=1 Tax=Streptomyces sp. AK02-01A TaxID=3028648 RepID=UPI0029A90C92|nr:serine/threonine-protein kinase [Streptomyces sp. AK02-01A]MDX3852206.1 serine/threonine-protein kinase [Streptomyces sp. AK02-01A]
MEYSMGTGAGADAGPGTGLVLAGRYRLSEAIGSGGMGKVWRAHDEVLHRTVAVKELTAGRYVSEADRAVLHQRTQKEARAAARITHPGVVTVHDVLDHDGRPWIVMQYVDGPSLADAVKESGRTGVREAARIGLLVLGALRAAHTAGVLHRDVKPGNVLLARDGGVLLTDFGIAAIEGDSTITRTGELVGSIDYLAPERVRGADPGPASDLWSLGVTLYTAVQGISPFRRTSPLSTMQAVVMEEPPHPDLAGPLAPVIAALLSKEPAERPGAAETERMLREVLDGPAAGDAEGYAPTRIIRDAGQQAPTARALPAEQAPEHGHGTGHDTGPGHRDGQDRQDGHNGAQTYGTRPSSGPAAVPTASVRRVRRRTTLVAVLVAAALGGGAGFAALKFANGEENASPSAGATAGQVAKGGNTKGGTVQSGSIPEGWTRVRADEGFSLHVPEGWERQMDGDQIDYTPDNGLHLIRISVATPDFENPYMHMLNMEEALQRLPLYQRVRLAPNTFRDQTHSALWEFTWTEEKTHPGKRHAIDQIYYSDDNNTEYAIYMSGPEKDWATTRKQFDVVLRSWQPPPGDAGQ